MADKLNIYLKKKTDAGFAKVASDVTLPYQFQDLNPGTDYEVGGKLENASGEGPMNTPTEFTTISIPDAPTIAIVAGNGKIDFTLTAGASDGVPSNGQNDLTGFKVLWKTASGSENWTTINNDPDQLTGSITGLTNGTDYQVKAVAVNAAGESAAGTTQHATPATVPGKPTATVEEGDASGNYTVTAPTDNGGSAITSYVYRLKKTSDATWGTQVDMGTDLTGAVAELENGTEYSIEFAAVNAIGQSPWDDSLAVHFTPTAA
ncbi:fibronectin type III domain-containing protein [Sporolactobacillus shoreicorticis]|uniref:Fibronectin type III domain-containing protein n=1 Tax=Sporolactobacillus shoreicorticis TaxID=1923877 RepID=A0ABW5S6H7_9BACL|nr:fibronectin type III domain-containing protein [Sporolactobacillus shoreicorticis]MCO7127816.1 fibronectin type III domain-containing protein [Sporolactobacillus shoreicorticis]